MNNAFVTQLVECSLCKRDVVGSNPIEGFLFNLLNYKMFGKAHTYLQRGIPMRHREKLEKSCKHCEKPVPNRNMYCDNQCQADYVQIKKIREWKETGEISNSVQLSRYVRKYLYEKCDYKCTVCSFSGTNSYHGRTILEIDHIDGNHLNNKEDNLRVLCPNCHAMTPTYRNTGGRKGTRKYRNKS